MTGRLFVCPDVGTTRINPLICNDPVFAAAYECDIHATWNSPEMKDYLHHWPAIAAHVGVKPDADRHLAKTQGLPVFRLGKTVAASRAKIDLWMQTRIAEAEAAEAQRKAESPK